MRPYSLLLAAVLALGAVVPAHAETKPKQKVQPMVLPNFNQPDVSAANSGYTLTPEDLKLDCKKLTGKIQLGIVQLRSERGDKPSSELSRTMQKAATPFIAGSNYGISPEGDQARALSKIKAYNGHLAAKNCPTFDLDADLAPGASETPRPVRKAKPLRAAPAPAAKTQ